MYERYVSIFEEWFLLLKSYFQSLKQGAWRKTDFFGSKTKCQNAFENNSIVIFSAGTGNPYFTTDTTSAMRAVEIEADIILKGTRVEGV